VTPSLIQYEIIPHSIGPFSSHTLGIFIRVLMIIKAILTIWYYKDKGYYED